MAVARPESAARPARAVDAELPLVAATFDAGLLDDQPDAAPGETVRQLYHLARFERATGVGPAELDTVVEWDSGRGGLARLVSSIRGGRLTYVLIATEREARQRHRALAGALGAERVKLVDREGAGVGGGRVNVVPETLIAGVRLSCDLFVATGDVDEAARDLIAARRWFGARHLLLTADDGSRLAEDAIADGASAEPVGDHRPGVRYLFR